MTIESAQLLASSKYFDRYFYEKESGFEFPDDVSAAKHYIEVGAIKRFRPSVHFDPTYYLEANGDVAEAGIEPLLHFVEYGLKEGRRAILSRSPKAASPVAPEDHVWTAFAQKRAKARAAAPQQEVCIVDIVIPVYRGYDDTLACIQSVLSAPNQTPYNLVVIDDCSPEPELSEKLGLLSELGLITLFRNPENLGFVGTVNRGMRLHDNRDVILLNSDTIVYHNWIDRLRHQAYSSDRVATVTPLSNNATIFSYPYNLRSNNQELEIGFSELDIVVSESNRGKYGVVPTGVGFCFYIRREALDEVGYFDEDLFGKGYGEENDFCMRAIEHGWLNLAAYDTFVRHTGEVSFAAGASQVKREGFRRLVATHPRYEGIIADYIRRNPMREARASIDVARFAKASGGKGLFMVEHGWGGGIEKHIEELADLAAAENIPSIICKASKGGRHLLSITHSDDYPNLPDISWNDVKEAATILRSLNLGKVHIHSLVGFSKLEVSNMLAAIKNAELEFDFTVHDYAPICPRITMIDWGGSYCDTPSRTYCGICLERSGSNFGNVDINSWVDAYRVVFDAAEHIYVPSLDVATRLSRNGHLDYPYIVRPHPRRDYPVAPKRPIVRKSVRRIGIIGAIGFHKGSRLLRAMSADALSRNLPIEYIVYGYTDFDTEKYNENITVTGRYRDEMFSDLFYKIPCDIAFFSSLWPETFCYSLDHAFNNQIYPVAFSFGAPADRIRSVGFGSVIDQKYMFSPSLLNDILLSMDISSPLNIGSEPERAWKTIEAYYSKAE